MVDTNIVINHKSYRFECKEEEKLELISAAEEFNNRLLKLKKTYPKSPSDTLSIMVGLELQGMVLQLQRKNQNILYSNSKELDLLNLRFSEAIKKIRILTEKLENGTS